MILGEARILAELLGKGRPGGGMHPKWPCRRQRNDDDIGYPSPHIFVLSTESTRAFVAHAMTREES